ncbi:hypothetical protein COO60DRAFT_4306 [Scenedesmus sp. NREL 46B-D3]|nr:hypothetical protein COO60DRAFT_4306 [Scenedesmus sp. NREL 46B-D3]
MSSSRVCCSCVASSSVAASRSVQPAVCLAAVHAEQLHPCLACDRQAKRQLLAAVTAAVSSKAHAWQHLRLPAAAGGTSWPALYAAVKLRQPAAAAAGPLSRGAAANAQGLLPYHTLGSPLQAQIAAWPVSAAPLSPVAVSPSPAASTNNTSYFQLLSPCAAAPAAAAASPAMPQLLAQAPTPCLVRHASAGLLLPSHCTSLPPAPLPYRPALHVQHGRLQGIRGSADALASAEESGLYTSTVQELQPQLVQLAPHTNSSSASSPNSSPAAPCSPESDVMLDGSHDCCVGLRLLPANSCAAKQVLPVLPGLPGLWGTTQTRQKQTSSI